MTDIYVIMAYKWGQTNGHHYLVGASLSRESAIAVAEHEASDRGGKYGVAVYKAEQDIESVLRDCEHELIHYVPSMRGDDTKPSHSYRLQKYQSLGFRAADIVALGGTIEDLRRECAHTKSVIEIYEKIERDKKLATNVAELGSAPCTGCTPESQNKHSR